MGNEPNQALQQTGHANKGSARHYANFRVSRQLSLVFGFKNRRSRMSKVTRRQAITTSIVGGAAVLTGCSPVQAAKHSKALKVHAAMEGFRKKIPPDTRKFFAGTGLSVKGLEPYTMPHLDQIAEGLKVTTRKECQVLLTCLKDADLKLRYIAVQAINKATKAYPSGLNVECFTDTGSETHRKMLFRFLEVIDALPA